MGAPTPDPPARLLSRPFHPPPVDRRDAPRRQSSRPTPYTPGTHRVPSMRPHSGGHDAQGTGRMLRRSTAHWSDSSCSFAPVRQRRNVGKPLTPSDSPSADCRFGRPSGRSRHGSPSEVRFDHFHPLLARAGGIEFMLEAIHHVGCHIGDVDVKLLIPTSKLIDRPVLLA
jgi:hypothetical protein